MESKQIRETFINYFASKGHTIVPGWPVVPKGDPTLLFTNAGMNQFKDLLLGKEIRSYKRAANYQKCLRISGKHNDLEQVGKDDYHHTFFEMLGNWSFGDYFKKEAIEFAWELLTEVYKIDKKRLWATVYKDDDESENYWITRIGLPRERVLRFDEKYNFWEMGDVGPCGPCTEIHYDYGEEFGCGEPNCRPNCGCGRFVEVWNIVFMEYFRDENGTLHPLPQKNVDTGMGFERLTSIIQAKTSNYQTDLFQPIIKKLEQLSGKWFLDEKNKIPMRVIADHIRAISFAIADGVIPGNEGRGYVIRRILRRASRYGRELDFHTPFLYKLVEPLVGIMGDAYPELEKHRDEIEKIIASEEERFIQTLDRGIELFEDYAESLLKEGKKILPGKLVFKLYDTYGFPVDLTELIAGEKGLSIDIKGFEEELEKQRELARGSHKFVHIYDKGNWKFDSKFSGKDSIFVGYTEKSVESNIVGYKIEDDKYYIILDKTPFWGETGGQVGDTGTIKGETFELDVIDCKRDGDRIVHIAKVKSGSISFGRVFAAIDFERRMNIARNHTATHLLHAALRSVLGEYVRQAGSLVEPTRLRFDYTSYEKPTDDQLGKAELLINTWIIQDHPVRTYYMKYKQALDDGVIAIFEEKYGEDVRVVEIEGISRELCGGTHLTRTSLCGSFTIIKEEAIAAGIRRIEALTGIKAYEYNSSLRKNMHDIAQKLRCATQELNPRIDELIQENRNIRTTLEQYRKKLINIYARELAEKAEKIKQSTIIVNILEAIGEDELLGYIDAIKERIGSGCVVLLGQTNKRIIFVVYVTDDLISKGIRANELLKEIAALINGKGGGKADLARGGGKFEGKIEPTIDKVKNIIIEKLKSIV